MNILIFVTSAIFIHSATSSSSSSSSSSSESSECNLKYTYTLWVGDDVDNIYSINLKSKCDIYFIDAMKQAAAKNRKFKFTKTVHPEFGAFITSIAGVQNNDDLSQYWIIYELTSKPDVNNKPAVDLQTEVGVSSLEVLDDYHYLFWYKTELWEK